MRRKIGVLEQKGALEGGKGMSLEGARQAGGEAETERPLKEERRGAESRAGGGGKTARKMYYRLRGGRKHTFGGASLRSLYPRGRGTSIEAERWPCLQKKADRAAYLQGEME